MAAGTPGPQDLRYIAGLTAGADLSAKQYLAVKFASTANAVIVCSATSDAAIGVLQGNPKSGEAALVAYDGIAIGLAGTSNLAVGSQVGFDTTSRIVARTTAGRRLGRNLDAPSAIGDYIRVALFGGGAV